MGIHNPVILVNLTLIKFPKLAGTHCACQTEFHFFSSVHEGCTALREWNLDMSSYVVWSLSWQSSSSPVPQEQQSSHLTYTTPRLEVSPYSGWKVRFHLDGSVCFLQLLHLVIVNGEDIIGIHVSSDHAHQTPSAALTAGAEVGSRTRAKRSTVDKSNQALVNHAFNKQGY